MMTTINPLTSAEKSIILARQVRDRLTKFVGDGIDGCRQSPPRVEEICTICNQMEKTAGLIRIEISEEDRG